MVILFDKEGNEHKTYPVIVTFTKEQIIEAAERTVTTVDRFVRYTIEEISD
jgi:hypothetical protein